MQNVRMLKRNSLCRHLLSLSTSLRKDVKMVIRLGISNFSFRHMERFVCCRECKRKINGINEEKHIPSYVQMV